jgi:hypothetical protein
MLDLHYFPFYVPTFRLLGNFLPSFICWHAVSPSCKRECVELRFRNRHKINTVWRSYINALLCFSALLVVIVYFKPYLPENWFCPYVLSRVQSLWTVSIYWAQMSRFLLEYEDITQSPKSYVHVGSKNTCLLRCFHGSINARFHLGLCSVWL